MSERNGIDLTSLLGSPEERTNAKPFQGETFTKGQG